jgi:crotonobetaine/carnitine-CoA ligase
MNNLDLSNKAERNLGLILSRHAAQIPEHIFLRAEEKKMSFREADERVNRIAAGLRQSGLGRGDRVAVFMHSRIEYVLIVLAVNKLGAVWVPVNTDYKGSWLLDTLNESKIKILATDDELLERVLEIEKDIACAALLLVSDGEIPPSGKPIHRLSDFYALPADAPDLSDIHYGDTAAILWTSGTTGRPKGVMQSHNAWIRTAECGNDNFETRPGDVVYNCLPLYNSAAWGACIFRALVAGITCVLERRFSVSNYWDRIRYYGATQTISVGALHMFLWNQPRQENDADNPLRIASMVPIPHDIIGQFCERFGMEALTQGFGQSEIMALMQKTDRPGALSKRAVLGTPLKDLQVKLMDDNGKEVAIGQVGEFCVRPLEKYVIFNGYFDRPEATAAAFFGDWYRMGDLGRQDEDGDFYFVDRKKDYIRYKGRNITSFDVESVAMKHPAVYTAAVFGIPSKELESESEVKLNVVLKPGQQATAAELARFINDNAPYFLVPRYIEICSELPYTPTGKVEKYKLRALGVTAATWDRLESDFVLER